MCVIGYVIYKGFLHLTYEKYVLWSNIPCFNVPVLQLFIILDAPYCKPDQVQVFGVAREETVRISCEVVSNPIGSTTFEWKFNASGEIVDMPHDRYFKLTHQATAE